MNMKPQTIEEAHIQGLLRKYASEVLIIVVDFITESSDTPKVASDKLQARIGALSRLYARKITGGVDDAN